MCQTVFSLGYYGIKKTTKTYKSQGMQLSLMKTADVTLKTQNEIGGCLTQQINALLFVMACQSLHFNFHITNFPFLSSNTPSSPAYGVFISQLIRYARASSSYECFILRAVRLSNKLLGQGYVKERLRSSLRKFYGRYGDVIKQYEVPLSRMLHDILDDDHLQ